MKEGVWEQLFQLMLLDAMHKDLLQEGYAINSSGIAIDMEEVKKAEEMYEQWGEPMIGIDRPKFRELHRAEIDIDNLSSEGYDIVQLKMDGIWGAMTISNGEYTIHSRTGKLKPKIH